MSNGKPKSIAEYKTWLLSSHNVDTSARAETYYNSVLLRLRDQIAASKFWTAFCEQLRDYGEDYLIKTGYPLLTSPEQPRLFMKTFESALQKSFRKNVLQNKRWPNAPDGSWILPGQWFDRLNDLIRTVVVVKYLDSVHFLVDKVAALCTATGAGACKVFYEAREDGYYAIHIYVSHRCEIPTPTWDTEFVVVQWELQITTQLQDVIRQLLHRYYESQRLLTGTAGPGWQWQYEREEFAAHYLGHILHYLEGMIVDIRDKQRGQR